MWRGIDAVLMEAVYNGWEAIDTYTSSAYIFERDGERLVAYFSPETLSVTGSELLTLSRDGNFEVLVSTLSRSLYDQEKAALILLTSIPA